MPRHVAVDTRLHMVDSAGSLHAVDGVDLRHAVGGVGLPRAAADADLPRAAVGAGLLRAAVGADLLRAVVDADLPRAAADIVHLQAVGAGLHPAFVSDARNLHEAHHGLGRDHKGNSNNSRHKTPFYLFSL